MKKATTLTELLDGYGGTKNITSDDAVIPYIEQQTKELMHNEDETIDSTDMSMELGSSPSLATSQIASQDKSNESVQSFLMNSRLRKNDLQPVKSIAEKTEVISLVDDFNDEPGFENDRPEGLLSPGARVTTPSNFKKTALKDLFNNFRQPKDKQVKLNPSVVTSTFIEHNGKKNRQIAQFHEAPFPCQQLVEPSDIIIDNKNLNLSLSPRRETPSSVISFNPDEYKALYARDTSAAQSKHVKIAKRKTKHNVLWTELLKPTTLKDVMLEPALKEDVDHWISQAFNKLKRRTTRNKMLKRQRPENDPLDAFIVEDEIEDESTVRDDFTPLMILFGDGIGKNTLIEVLMEGHRGQIYEVNASSNRSKKDILDSLLEFSTTHYVKGQGSKGVILLDEVDVLFKEHDKFFWQTIEKVLLTSRRPIIMLCRDLDFVPDNLVQLALGENSLFHCKRVSHQTVTKFLQRYCRRLGVEIDQNILKLLVTCSKRDVRKCLMDLEFCCTPPGTLRIPEAQPQTSSLEVDLAEASRRSELISWSDIVQSKTNWKSSISQESDNTLMTPHSQAVVSGLSDEQERFQNDYMMDYRLHLVDNVNQAQLPFELNIGRFLEEKMAIGDLSKFTKHNKLEAVRYNKMKNATIDYLSTRIGKKSLADVRPRKTRNSRKIQEILESFEGTDSSHVLDESVAFDFQAINDRNIKEQINPYVLEVAKKDLQVKQENRRLFVEQCEGVGEAQYNEVAWRLTHERLLKPIWFQADPKTVIQSWK